MTLPAYPAARSVAARVQSHFIRHLAAARDAGRTDVAPVPDAVAIEALIDVAFWASLRREEGVATTLSIAYVAPEQAGLAMKFETDLPLEPAALARLAPAVERPGIHLGVWRIGPELRVWGTTRRLPAFCFVIEVVMSGLLVVKQRSEPFGKFVNVAVLEGDQVKIIDERGASVPDCPGDAAVAARVRRHRRPRRGGERARAAGGVDARARKRRDTAGGPVRERGVARVDRLADALRRGSAVHRACRSDEADCGRPDPRVAGPAAARGRCASPGSRPSTARRSYRTPTRCWRSAPRSRRAAAKPSVERVIVTEPIEGSVTTVGDADAARRHAAPVSRAVRARSARGDRRWSPRRTGGSPSSSGRLEKTWSMRTGLKRYCCKVNHVDRVGHAGKPLGFLKIRSRVYVSDVLRGP